MHRVGELLAIDRLSHAGVGFVAVSATEVGGLVGGRQDHDRPERSPVGRPNTARDREALDAEAPDVAIGAREFEVEEREHWSLEGVVRQPLEGQPAIGDVGAVVGDAGVAQRVVAQFGVVGYSVSRILPVVIALIRWWWRPPARWLPGG